MSVMKKIVTPDGKTVRKEGHVIYRSDPMLKTILCRKANFQSAAFLTSQGRGTNPENIPNCPSVYHPSHHQHTSSQRWFVEPDSRPLSYLLDFIYCTLRLRALVKQQGKHCLLFVIK